jgi:SAM-dependent methyltransferase
MSIHTPVEDQTRIWTHFQNEAPGSFARSHPRLDYISHQIQKIGRRPLRVLNIGIGDGYLEEQLLAFGCDVSALDPDASSVQRMNERGVQARVGHIEQMTFEPASFDVVVTSEVLEHLSDEQRQQALAEVHRTLRRDGAYFGTVPCDEDLNMNICVCPHCGVQFHRWGHRSSFTPQSVRQQLSPWFDVRVCYATAFPGFRRSLPGQIKAVTRVALARFRAAIALPTIFWKAVPR